jgi:transposase-like protein
MKKRQWTNQQKAQIVLEGLSGQIEVAKLCAKYEIAQTQYYKWRDLFIKECHSTLCCTPLSRPLIKYCEQF